MINHNEYVTKKDLDYILNQIIDFIKTSNEATAMGVKEELKQYVTEETSKITKQINEMDSRFTKIFEELKNTTFEIKDLNKNILGIISYHENRISILEKQSHIHTS